MNYLVIGVVALVYRLFVPLYRDNQYFAAAEIIEICLIRIKKIKIVFADQVNELLFDLILTEPLQIDDQHACVDVLIRIHPQCLFGIATELLGAANELLGSRRQEVVPQIHVIQTGDVPQHHKIAIQINDLIVLRKQRGDEQAVIGHDGKMVDVLKTGFDFFQGLGNIDKLNDKSGAFPPFDLGNPLRRKPRIQDHQSVLVFLGGIVYQRSNGNVKVRDILIVGGKKDRNFFWLYDGFIVQNSTSRASCQ